MSLQALAVVEHRMKMEVVLALRRLPAVAMLLVFMEVELEHLPAEVTLQAPLVIRSGTKNRISVSPGGGPSAQNRQKVYTKTC